MPTKNEVDYVRWQNHAFRFYLASRLLWRGEIKSPAAFCAFQTLENLMKATLVYWVPNFRPKKINHKMDKMIEYIKSEVENSETFECPEYFYFQGRYQSITRYPEKGKGVLIPDSLLDDLDKAFCVLIKFVPFQFNTMLKHALSGKEEKNLKILRWQNHQIRVLRKFLGVRLVK